MRMLGILTAVLLASAEARAESFEACTYEGPCALRVTSNDGEGEIWLVKEDSTGLSTIWDGRWYLVPDSDYEKVRDMIPESQRFTVRAINPTTGDGIMEAKKGGGTTPVPVAPGPLVSGSISVNVSTGGGNCTDCHKGSVADIHKKKLETGGK